MTLYISKNFGVIRLSEPQQFSGSLGAGGRGRTVRYFLADRQLLFAKETKSSAYNKISIDFSTRLINMFLFKYYPEYMTEIWMQLFKYIWKELIDIIMLNKVIGFINKNVS